MEAREATARLPPRGTATASQTQPPARRLRRSVGRKARNHIRRQRTCFRQALPRKRYLDLDPGDLTCTAICRTVDSGVSEAGGHHAQDEYGREAFSLAAA